MKHYIYATSIGLVLIASTTVQSTFASSAATKNNIPSEFSVLSDAELDIVDSLTWSARDEYLASKGITHQTNSGSLDHIPGGIELTEAEYTALKTMTETERQAFFTSKWLTPPTGSGKLQNTKNTRLIKQNQTQSGTTLTTTTTVDSQKKVAELSRAERIAQNKAKQLEQKKQKLQNKINAGENLTRLEKKFADKNGIEY